MKMVNKKSESADLLDAIHTPRSRSRSDVFIIESLTPADECVGRLEGDTISHLLRLHGKSPEYRYVRTRSQFIEAVEQFASSNYRYLHISAHGNHHGLCTTNLEEINYGELGDLLAPSLEERRLFLSACSMVHDDMARKIIPKTGCYSIVGPTEDIEFTVAAVFWPSIYHLMFSANDKAMKRAELRKNLRKVSKLFDVDIGYFSFSSSAKQGYAKVVLKHD